MGHTAPPSSLTFWTISIRGTFSTLPTGFCHCHTGCSAFAWQYLSNSSSTSLGFTGRLNHLKFSSKIFFLAKFFSGWSDCHSYLSMSKLHPKKKKNQNKSKVATLPRASAWKQCPDSDIIFLTCTCSRGEKDNGSGHCEKNVFLFSSITDSDAHICQTTPSQLPTDPSGCSDMMRGGLEASFKGFVQKGPPSALEKCFHRMLSLARGSLGLHQHQPLLSWEANEQTQSRSPRHHWLSWPQTLSKHYPGGLSAQSG